MVYITFLVTYKCTQVCTHCAYSCDPLRTEHMHPDILRDYLEQQVMPQARNESVTIVLSGGEFSCHPHYPTFFAMCANVMASCKNVWLRLRTNGDWACSYDRQKRMLEALSVLPAERVEIWLSGDLYHTRTWNGVATEFAQAHGYDIDTKGSYGPTRETTRSGLLPIGRSHDVVNRYSVDRMNCKPGNMWTPTQDTPWVVVAPNGISYPCCLLSHPLDVTQNVWRERAAFFEQLRHITAITNCKACLAHFQGA